MGCKGICRFFCRRLLEILVVILLITFLPNLPPFAKFSQSISAPKFKPLENKLALNEKLSGGELWHKNELNGPEAFTDFNGELYTSLSGGDIVKLVGNHITPVVRTGKPCKSSYQERICGRPLGIKFDSKGNLYAADAYYGILKINVKTGEKQVLVDSNQEIAGRKPMIFNSIALASNGDIYWTDSSSDFHLEDGLFTVLADPTGRLIHYDARSKTNRVLIDNLHFANGVMLSDDESFVIVAESFRSRIHRYHLTGPKKGTQDIFIDGLPGFPDNINSDGRGGFLIPLVVSVDSEHPNIGQIIQPFPLLKKFLARIMGITKIIFETINRIYPSEFTERSIHYVGHFMMLPRSLDPARTTIVHLSDKGEVIDSLSTLDKNIYSISEAHILKEYLYLGSPFNNHIVRIPLSKIGWSDLTQKREKRDVPETPKTTPPPKQTTTSKQQPTPKPQKQQTTTTPPKQQTPQAEKETPSKQETPPKQQTPPPKQQTPPPKQQTPPPKQQTPPPKQQTPSPKQQTPPPTKQTPPPTQQTPPPKQQTPPPKQQTPPPTQQTPPPKQQTPPPKQQTPPPKQQTPPPKQQAPPPKQQAPPPKQQTPPAKQDVPPPKQQTPPAKQDTPSPKQQTPPVKQQTPSNQNPPSKHQATPQKQATNPPAQQTTPPRAQATPNAGKQTTPSPQQQATPTAQVKEQVKAVPVRDTPRAKNS